MFLKLHPRRLWRIISVKTEKNIGRELLWFSVPICATNLFGIFVNFFSILFVAQLGEFELAASALATTTFTTIFLISTAPLFAISILVGNVKQQPDGDYKAKQIFYHGCIFAFFLTLLSFYLLNYADHFLIAIGQEPDLVLKTKPYFHYAAWSMPFMLISTLITQYFIGLGYPIVSLIATVVRLPFNILFAYVLVLGKMDCHSRGLSGVMLATLIVQSIAALGLVLFLYWHLSSKNKRKLFCQFEFRLADFKKLLALGLPMGIQLGSELCALSLLIYLIGYLGAEPLAASQYVSQFGLIIIMIYHGTGQALTVFVSQADGASNNRQILRLLQCSHKFILIITLIAGLLFFTAYQLMPWIVATHSLNQNFAELTRGFFIIGLMALIIDGTRIYYSSVLRGLQMTTYPMLNGVLSIWFVSLPLSYFLAFSLNMGAFWVRIAYVVGLSAACIFLIKKTRITLHYKLENYAQYAQDASLGEA